MNPPIVVNKYKEEFDEYIGRGSIWGNPYEIDESKGMFRHIVIDLYRAHIYSKIEKGEITIQMIKNLGGKRLGCFCKPKDCHGDVIVEIYNIIMEMENDAG